MIINFYNFVRIGEETKNPKRDIPLAIVASLFLSTMAYCGVATVLTLMWPYYSQVRFSILFHRLKAYFFEDTVHLQVVFTKKFQDPDAPLPALYENLGMPVIKIIVSGGAIFALCTRYVLKHEKLRIIMLSS